MNSWKDMPCPKCGKVKVHVWYFGADCRGNDASSGADPCAWCGHKPSQKEKSQLLHDLVYGPPGELEKEMGAWVAQDRKMEARPTPRSIDFTGETLGVRLAPRGPDDLHVEVTIIAKTDTGWRESSGAFSSYWCRELRSLLKMANKWMKSHCTPEMHGHTQYGWRFKNLPL